ncbi:hypothetical protein CHU98_g1170 [Xylaria longipes]|nr:hypothetical protein CHU98_g1170 [Xylaria longipes]
MRVNPPTDDNPSFYCKPILSASNNTTIKTSDDSTLTHIRSTAFTLRARDHIQFCRDGATITITIIITALVWNATPLKPPPQGILRDMRTSRLAYLAQGNGRTGLEQPEYMPLVPFVKLARAAGAW